MRIVDGHGQYHAKATEDFPSSNDGLIISAYAVKLGFAVDAIKLRLMWAQLKKRNDFPIERTPGKPTPYPSRDFYLAAIFFKLVSVQQMLYHGWNFSPVQLPKLNVFKLVWQLWQLRNKDRNYFWMNPGFEQVYHTAFMVPLTDRAFYFRCEGLKAPWIYRVIEWFSRRFTPSNGSSVLIAWLKYNEKPLHATFVNYFGAHHPFSDAAKEYLK